MLAALLAAALCGEYFELTPDNAAQFIGGPRPILVKFYNPECPHCRAMADAFAACGRLFPGVLFGGMDCVANKRLCQAYNVNNYPTVHLFHAGSTEPVDYDGDKTLASFADFVELHTSAKPGRRAEAQSALRTLSPGDFQKFISSKSCPVVLFYKPSAAKSQLALAAAEQIERAFAADPNVSVASLNCEKHSEACAQQRAADCPIVRIARGGTWREAESVGVDAVLAFVNEECGTDRGVDGLPGDGAGTVREADALVSQFLAAEDRAAVIEAMKKIEGAEFYVRVMERWLEGGEEKLRKDAEGMKAILDQRKGSAASLDGLKRRYNVFRRFVRDEEVTEAEL
jgi:protein disulfide-isomerase A6